MSRANALDRTRGILLVGTHPWSTAFDSLLPRTLLPVAHRPLLWYGLSWMHNAGIARASVCGNRETRLLRSRLDRHVPKGMTVSYHEDAMPRGAAGSARDAALATDAETFVVADGSAVPNIDLTEVLERHRASGACLTVVVHADNSRTEDQALHVPSGIYLFERRALELAPPGGFCDIKEKLIPQLYEAGERVLACEAAAATPRVLDAATYIAVNEWMVDRIVRSGDEAGGYMRMGTALVHRDAFVADDAVLVGPVLVGAGAAIESGAVIIGPASIGREATIAASSMVSRSAIWRRAIVGEQAMADRSIVADDAIVEAGSELLRGVAIADGWSEHDADWVNARRVVLPQKGFSFDFGARLGRFVFGPSWSRSPMPQ